MPETDRIPVGQRAPVNDVVNHPTVWTPQRPTMSTTCSKLRHRAGQVCHFCQIRKAFTPLDALVLHLVLPLISPSGPFTPLSRPVSLLSGQNMRNSPNTLPPALPLINWQDKRHLGQRSNALQNRRRPKKVGKGRSGQHGSR